MEEYVEARGGASLPLRGHRLLQQSAVGTLSSAGEEVARLDRSAGARVQREARSHAVSPDEKLGVLIVEDDADQVYIIRGALSALGFSVVVTAQENGQAALDHLAGLDDESLPRLILLDLHMPVLDGRGFLQKARSDVRFAGIPIIVLTGDEDTRTLRGLYDLGAHSVVAKADTLNGMFDIVRAVATYWLNEDTTTKEA
ncbi:MAG: response regulator [Pseudomonadota bacterium]